MGKQKAKRVVNNDAEQTGSAKGLAHLSHSNSRNSSSSRHVIKKREQLSKKTGEDVKQGCGDERGRRETTTTSHQRSKSLTSMNRRKVDKRFSADKSAKSTANDKEHANKTEHRLLRSSSVEQEGYLTSLRPILKRDQERTQTWVRQSHTGKPLRKVSLVTSGSSEHQSSEPRGSLIHSRSVEQVPSLSAIVNKREVKRLAEKMASNRSALSLYANADPSHGYNQPQTNNHIHGSSDTHSVQVHQDVNGQSISKFTNYRTSATRSHLLVAEQSGNTRLPQTTNNAQFLGVGTSANVEKQGGHNLYREIWIGQLPEPPCNGNQAEQESGSLVELINLNAEELNPSRSPPALIHSDTANLSDWTSAEEASSDLIDLSVELPSTVFGNWLKQDSDNTGDCLLMTAESSSSLGSVNSARLMEKTFQASSAKVEDPLISKLLEKMHCDSTDSVFLSEDRELCSKTKSEKQTESETTAVDDDSSTLICDVKQPADEDQLATQCGISLECNSDNINLSNSNNTSNEECSVETSESTETLEYTYNSLPKDQAEKPAEILLVSDKPTISNGVTCRKTSLNVDSSAKDVEIVNEEKSGPVLVPPPCTFSNGGDEPETCGSQQKTSESALSVRAIDSADTTTDMPAQDSDDGCLIGISSKDAEFSCVHTTNCSTRFSSNQEFAECSTTVYSEQTACAKQDIRKALSADSPTLNTNTVTSEGLRKETHSVTKHSRDQTVEDLEETLSLAGSDSSKKCVTIATATVISRRRHTVAPSQCSKSILKNTASTLERHTLIEGNFSKDLENHDLCQPRRPSSIGSGDDETVSLDEQRNSNVDFLRLPRLELPKRPEKPRSKSLELVIDENQDPAPARHSLDSSIDKGQSLSRDLLLHRSIVKSSYSQRGSFSERFSLPGTLTRMFSKKKKLQKQALKDSPSDETQKEPPTYDSLYSDWLDKASKTQYKTK